MTNKMFQPNFVKRNEQKNQRRWQFVNLVHAGNRENFATTHRVDGFLCRLQVRHGLAKQTALHSGYVHVDDWLAYSLRPCVDQFRLAASGHTYEDDAVNALVLEPRENGARQLRGVSTQVCTGTSEALLHLVEPQDDVG